MPLCCPFPTQSPIFYSDFYGRNEKELQKELEKWPPRGLVWGLLRMLVYNREWLFTTSSLS